MSHASPTRYTMANDRRSPLKKSLCSAVRVELFDVLGTGWRQHLPRQFQRFGGCRPHSTTNSGRCIFVFAHLEFVEGRVLDQESREFCFVLVKGGHPSGVDLLAITFGV